MDVKELTSIYFDEHSATSNSILDRAIDSEEAQHKDFLRLVNCIPNGCCLWKIIFLE